MDTVFVKATVFIGDGRVLENGSVIVEGERIVKVAAGEVSAPKGAKVIDLAGQTLLPGFIDCHVHICFDASADPATQAQKDSPTTMALKSAQFARRTVLAGVTTIRDMGGMNGVDYGLRDAIRAGLIEGPRILASGQLICMTGGHGWMLGGREADGPDEVRKAAREQIKAGSDLVKLMATGGVMTPGVEPGSAQLTEEELRAGVEEAHKAGRKAASHAQGTDGVLNALRAGIDSIEHGIFLDDECVSLMLDRRVTFIPTISALTNISGKGVADGLPDYVVEKTARVRPFQLESIRLAHGAGVTIAAGTDAGTPFNRHGDNLQEIKRLVEIGLSPIEALKAGTHLAAQVLGLEEELGLIEEGKLADLVAVKGSPLDDVGLLTEPEKISLVMRSGRTIKG